MALFRGFFEATMKSSIELLLFISPPTQKTEINLTTKYFWYFSHLIGPLADRGEGPVGGRSKGQNVILRKIKCM